MKTMEELDNLWLVVWNKSLAPPYFVERTLADMVELGNAFYNRDEKECPGAVMCVCDSREEAREKVMELECAGNVCS